MLLFSTQEPILQLSQSQQGVPCQLPPPILVLPSMAVRNGGARIFPRWIQLLLYVRVRVAYMQRSEVESETTISPHSENFWLASLLCRRTPLEGFSRAAECPRFPVARRLPGLLCRKFPCIHTLLPFHKSSNAMSKPP